MPRYYQSDKNCVIHINDEITEETFLEFHNQVIAAELKKQNITLIIHSQGGVTFSALAYYDVIRQSSVEFTGIIYGCANSAATLIFAACKHRLMAPNAWLGLHEDQHTDLEEMSTTGIEAYAARNRRFENQWLRLMTESTGVSLETWSILHNGETWLDAEECAALGLSTIKGVN